MSNPTTHLGWADTLEAAARSTLGDAPARELIHTAAAEPFRDEFGNAPRIAPFFFAWRTLLARDRAPDAVALPEPVGPDEALWAALTSPASNTREVLEARDRSTADRIDADRGALFPQADTATIEVWTERELCALHALRWHVRTDESHSELLRTVARWHVDTIQPDNATNRPWAPHVFIEIGLDEDRPEALLYAQTLMHNCTVGMGRPDTLSAHILLDAADALRTQAG